MSRICILGGGFGGLYTALNLSRLPWAETPEIILVDRSDRFLFTPLLYELITNELQTWEIAPRFLDVLGGTGVQFIQGTVSKVDVVTQQVQVSVSNQPTSVTYDYLVLAIGGETKLDLVPGALEYAIPFRTLADAERLKAKLTNLEGVGQEKIRVCIAGGGSSGVEIACKIADRLKEKGRVRLVERSGSILADSPATNRAAAERAILTRGIWTDLSTSVSAITDTEVTLDYSSGSDTLPVDIMMWTVGNSLSKVAYNLPLPHNSTTKKILTEPTLQVREHPKIFAIGDLAECLDADLQLVPATAQAALQQAQYCAWNIWASVTNHPLKEFRYLPLGEFVSLGTDSATLALFNQFGLEGPTAYVFRRIAYLMRMPTWQHQLKVGFNWLSQPVLDLIANRTHKDA